MGILVADVALQVISGLFIFFFHCTYYIYLLSYLVPNTITLSNNCVFFRSCLKESLIHIIRVNDKVVLKKPHCGLKLKF